MNQGEENRFDGLLRNKFDNFEEQPSHRVWDGLSERIPSKSGKTGLTGIRPFIAGLMLGMATMFGAGSAYLHLSEGSGAASNGFEASGNQQHQQANSQNGAEAGSEITNDQPGNSAVSGNAGSAVTGTEMAFAASRTVQPVKTIQIKTPEIRFISAPRKFRTTGSNLANASETARKTGTRKNTDTKNTYSNTRLNNSDLPTAANTTTRNRQIQNSAAISASSTEAGNSAGRIVRENASNSIVNNNAATSQAALNTTLRPLKVESAWLVGLELDTTISKELKALTPANPKPEQLQNLLIAQATVLALLQNRNDSLIASLAATDEDSLAAKARITRTPAIRSGSSVRPPAWPFPSKWAMALIVETTPGWGNIDHGAEVSSAKEDNLRSLSQQIRIQHRINSRLSVSGGLGMTQLHSSLRYSQYTEVPGDTIIIRNIDQTLTPSYNFITVPIALHQKIAGAGRLSIGLSGGTQVTVFNKGNRPVWNNDRYQLEKISTGEGPFRPVSVALHGSLDLSLRISPKVNLMASPTLRWWAINPFKENKTSYNMIPGLQVGMGWDF